MTVSCGQLGDLVMRMQDDFLEIPGLTLTLHDAERRFGVDEVTCDAVLSALADANVLTRNGDGAYGRQVPRPACTSGHPSSARGRRRPLNRLNEASPLSTHAA